MSNLKTFSDRLAARRAAKTTYRNSRVDGATMTADQRATRDLFWAAEDLASNERSRRGGRWAPPSPALVAARRSVDRALDALPAARVAGQ